MSYPYYEDVTRAHDELKAAGEIKPRSNQEEIEADKGLCVQRAAYYGSQKDARIGVMSKTSGNSYLAADGNRYSVDWIFQTDGVGYDVMTDNGVEALPVNGGPGTGDPSLWRPPSQANAHIEDGGGVDPGPDPGPEPIPDDAVQQILDAIAASEARVQENINAQAGETRQAVGADGQQTRDLIIHYADQVDTWATILLAVLIRQNRPPESMSAATALQRARKAIAEIRQVTTP